MSSLPSYRKIWQLSWPMMIGLLAENLVGVVDTAFLGHVGELELAASAIASTYYIILFVVGMGFGTGTQILIARRNGEKNFGQIGGIFENSLYFMSVENTDFSPQRDIFYECTPTHRAIFLDKRGRVFKRWS